MNIMTWKAYLRNSYYQYRLARNLATRSKNQNIHSRFFINILSKKYRKLVNKTQTIYYELFKQFFKSFQSIVSSIRRVYHSQCITRGVKINSKSQVGKVDMVKFRYHVD